MVRPTIIVPNIMYYIGISIVVMVVVVIIHTHTVILFFPFFIGNIGQKCATANRCSVIGFPLKIPNYVFFLYFDTINPP